MALIKVKYYTPIINYKDIQWRVCKNTPEIKWIGRVHERLTGAKTEAILPDEYHLIHPKTIERQEKQNELYSTL